MTCDDSCNDPTTIDIYRYEWTLVFVLTAEIYVFGSLVYLLLGSGKTQWWAEGCEQRDDLETTPSFSLQPFIPKETDDPGGM